MINPSDTSALTFQNFQTESPLSKLVEHCNKFGHDSKAKFEKLENAKVATTESLLLPADMNPYAQYHSFIPTTNWWVEQAAWPLAYQTATTTAAEIPYQSYLSNPLLLGGTNASANLAATSVNLAAAAVATSSVVPRATGKSKASSTSSSSSTSANGGSSGGGGGGKYQARSNCECPNCQELERVGVNNLAARKRGVHNCHIAGCGKVYNKSSHLKAHLRWHSGERPSRTNKVKTEVSDGLTTIYQ